MCCSDHLDSQGPPYLIHLLPSMRQYDEPGDDEGRDDGEDRDDEIDHGEDGDNNGDTDGCNENGWRKC